MNARPRAVRPVGESVVACRSCSTVAVPRNGNQTAVRIRSILMQVEHGKPLAKETGQGSILVGLDGMVPVR